LPRNNAADRRAELERLQQIADWLDSRFRIPGTGIRFGADTVAGLLPVVGDGVAAIPALYLLVRARHLGAPKSLILRMAGNLVVDLVFGAIPLVGDLFDLGFKANRRNVALLRAHIEAECRHDAPH
jgi:hypothetical protein